MKKRSLRTVLAAALIVSCLSQSTSYGAWIENNSAWQYQVSKRLGVNRI